MYYIKDHHLTRIQSELRLKKCLIDISVDILIDEVSAESDSRLCLDLQQRIKNWKLN